MSTHCYAHTLHTQGNLWERAQNSCALSWRLTWELKFHGTEPPELSSSSAGCMLNTELNLQPATLIPSMECEPRTVTSVLVISLGAKMHHQADQSNTYLCFPVIWSAIRSQPKQWLDPVFTAEQILDRSFLRLIQWIKFSSWPQPTPPPKTDPPTVLAQWLEVLKKCNPFSDACKHSRSIFRGTSGVGWQRPPHGSSEWDRERTAPLNCEHYTVPKRVVFLQHMMVSGADWGKPTSG